MCARKYRISPRPARFGGGTKHYLAFPIVGQIYATVPHNNINDVCHEKNGRNIYTFMYVIKMCTSKYVRTFIHSFIIITIVYGVSYIHSFISLRQCVDYGVSLSLLGVPPVRPFVGCSFSNNNSIYFLIYGFTLIFQ